MKKSGFTLAEAISVLVLLGTVAAITIPSVWHNVRVSADRTRLKKAMALYDSVIRTFTTENRISSNNRLNQEGSDNNCANIRRYFKVIDGNGSCQFRTVEGVWWDMSTPSKALVAFERGNLNRDTAIDERSRKAFYFVTMFDENKKLRINDMAYANTIGISSNILNISKAYSFVNSKKQYEYFNFCKNKNSLKSCIYNTCQEKENGKKGCLSEFYDKNGNWIGQRNNCEENALYCTAAYIPWEENPEKNNSLGFFAKQSYCDIQGDNCKTSYHYYSDSKNYPEVYNKIPDSIKKSSEFGNPDYVITTFTCDSNYTGNIADCPQTYIFEYYKVFGINNSTAFIYYDKELKSVDHIGISAKRESNKNNISVLQFKECTGNTTSSCTCYDSDYSDNITCP